MDEEYKETYEYIFSFYKNCKEEELIKMWTIHNQLTGRENDFNFIGRKVCEDIFKDKVS